MRSASQLTAEGWAWCDRCVVERDQNMAIAGVRDRAVEKVDRLIRQLTVRFSTNARVQEYQSP